MDRRSFHRLCGGLLGGATTLHRQLAAAESSAPPASTLAGVTGESGPWPRTRLLDDEENPLTVDDIAPGESRVFHYPFRVTPCFLVRLEARADRVAPVGGVGRDHSVLAFSAICSHKMSHPARPISHIAYRAEAVAFTDHDGQRQRRRGTISCCSERSVYDPADGARVLAGPAPVPLAAIALALDDDGTIVATASLGQDRYAPFLDAFGFRLALEHGTSDVRRRSGDTAVATPAERFSHQQIRC